MIKTHLVHRKTLYRRHRNQDPWATCWLLFVVSTFCGWDVANAFWLSIHPKSECQRFCVNTFPNLHTQNRNLSDSCSSYDIRVTYSKLMEILIKEGSINLMSEESVKFQALVRNIATWQLFCARIESKNNFVPLSPELFACHESKSNFKTLLQAKTISWGWVEHPISRLQWSITVSRLSQLGHQEEVANNTDYFDLIRIVYGMFISFILLKFELLYMLSISHGQ